MMETKTITTYASGRTMQVVVTIDWGRLAALYANKAATSKGKTATEAKGAVSVRYIQDIALVSKDVPT
jgi:hypothetical protein